MAVVALESFCATTHLEQCLEAEVIERTHQFPAFGSGTATS